MCEDGFAEESVARPSLLVITSTYPRWQGDPEPGFVHELSKRLAADFRVTVLCPHSPGALDTEVLDGVEVIRYHYAPVRWETLVNDGGIIANLRKSKWKILLLPTFVMTQAWNVWLLVRKQQTSIIHAHWLIPQGLIAVLISYLVSRSPPFVVTSHGADLYTLRGRVLNWLRRFVIRKAACATVVSTAMKDALEVMGADIRKIHVQSMGVDLSGRFVIDSSVKRSSDEILFVGRLVEKKGVKHLISAFSKLLQSYPWATLTIAGFGPEREDLERLGRDLGLDGKVQFLGAVSQSDLPKLYRRAAVFVAPFVRASSGDEEGLGLVLLEAIGCGCPVVVGNVQAVKDVLGDSVVEYVNAEDTDLLASRIIDVLGNPIVASERALRLRYSVAERFDWGSVAEQYRDLLKTHACVPASSNSIRVERSRDAL